jgi:hypothetical protein
MNRILEELTHFFQEKSFNNIIQEEYLILEEHNKLQIDYFPGRLGGFKSYARMGKSLKGKNVLVLKNIRLEDRGNNLVEKAVIELLQHPELDIVVLEDIEDRKWMERLLRGKNGRRHWLPSPIEINNVYLTKEQLPDFVGGKSKKRKRGGKSYRVKSRF